MSWIPDRDRMFDVAHNKVVNWLWETIASIFFDVKRPVKHHWLRNGPFIRKKLYSYITNMMSEYGHQFRSYLLESFPNSRTMSIGTSLPIWLPLLPSGMLTGRIGWSWRLKSWSTSPFPRFLAERYQIIFLTLFVLRKTILIFRNGCLFILACISYALFVSQLVWHERLVFEPEVHRDHLVESRMEYLLQEHLSQSFLKYQRVI